MSKILPSTKLGQLQFFEAHFQQWSDNAAQVGLNIDKITELNSLIGLCREAFDEQQVALEAAKSSTTTWNTALEALVAYGTDLILTIKAFAGTSDNPDVYGLAGIPRPLRPKDKPAPPAPVNVTGSLLNTGGVELKWRPPAGGFGGGVQFVIDRQLLNGGMLGPWGQVGIVGKKRTFTDATLPTGFDAAVYRVTAIRNNTASDASEPIIVQIGVVAGASSAVAGNSSQPVAEAA